MRKLSDLARGYIFALSAIIGFGGTFIAVKLGQESFDAITMSFGRVVPGAIVAIISLRAMGKTILPPKEVLPVLFGVTGGIVIGFPILSTFALELIPAADAGVIGAATPFVTALIAVSIGYKKPKPLFWLAAALGTVSATALAYFRGGSEIGGGAFWGYVLISTAVLAASIGHVSGNYLAGKGYSSYHVLCWAVVLSIPVQLTGTVINFSLHPITTTPTLSAVFGFLFASLFSILIGNYMMNHGFHLIGLVKGAQLQLIQPIVTMILSIVILHVAVEPITWMAAAAILASVAWSQRLK